MKSAFFIVANVLALCGAASAQVPEAPAPTTPVPFGCDARAPNVCYFRIFYTRGGRLVILPAGMKENKVPAIVGGNYCMAIGQSPVWKCARKVVNDKYNS
jgi:hypothetical protein